MCAHTFFFVIITLNCNNNQNFKIKFIMKKLTYLFTFCTILLGFTSSAQESIDWLTDVQYQGNNFTASLAIGHIPQNLSALATKNLVVGYLAGDALTNGDNNTALGWSAGTAIGGGQYNTVVGSNSGKLISSGLSNVVVGHNAGIVVAGGSNNTFVGTGTKGNAGAAANRTAVGKGIVVESDNMAVFGNSDTTIVELGDGGNTAAAHVGSLYLANDDYFSNASSGTITVSGNLTVSSDMRLKDNILPLGSTMTNILKLDGKSYTRDGREEIGLLAQDVQLVYPELVSEDVNGMLSVNYQALSAILINGVKDQEARIQKLEILVKLLLENK